MSAVARVPGADSDAAAIALRRDGVVAIELLWSAATIDDLREVVARQHPEFTDPAGPDDYLGDKNERFVAPVTITPEVRATGLLESAALEAVCRAMLGDEFVYEAFGMLWVHPGAHAQKPHRDGGWLFPESAVDRVLPPSAMTIAIPLVDLDPEFAPTGVVPGSHRLDASANNGELVPVELKRGDAAVWDFRTLHAGLANRTGRPRPALYFTACRPYWIDHLNFRKKARAKLIGDPAVIAALGPRFVRAGAR